MIARNDMLREQQKGCLQQWRLQEEAAAGKAATVEDAVDDVDEGNITPFGSTIRRGRVRPPAKAIG